MTPFKCLQRQLGLRSHPTGRHFLHAQTLVPDVGSGRTAAAASRLAFSKAKAVPLDAKVKLLGQAAYNEMKELRSKAESMQARLVETKEDRPYLKLRARVGCILWQQTLNPAINPKPSITHD